MKEIWIVFVSKRWLKWKVNENENKMNDNEGDWEFNWK
jgi:hypothetical protein